MAGGLSSLRRNPDQGREGHPKRATPREFPQAWIEKNGTDPLTREPLSKEDLVEDESASVESSKKLVTFLKSKREETVNNAPHLIEGFDALITDYREAAMCKHNNKLAILQKKWRENRITYEEFSQKSLALGDKYLSLV